jgi:hypothetical protein
MNELFHSQLWGRTVEVTPLPALVFTDDRTPALTAAEFCVYAVCCDEGKKATSNCKFTLSVTEIMSRTGYRKKSTVREALKGLVGKQFIRPFGQRQHRKPQTYELCNPLTGEGLSSLHTNKRKWVNLRGALHRAGLVYFWMPTHTIKGLSELSNRVFSLLLGVARLAALQGRRFEVESDVLRYLCGLDYKTFNSAVGEAEEPWVLITFTDATHKALGVILLDPATGESLEISEQERKEREQEEREQRFKDNRARNGKYSPVQLLSWAMWAFGDDLQAHGGSGEFITFCPVCHNTKKNRPGLRINVFKGTHGLHRCFECGTGGNLLRLIREHVGDFMTVIAKLAAIEHEHPELVQQAAGMLKNYDADGRYKAA